MKNNDLQELKPIYIHEAHYSTGDNTSLIDLAMILAHRKVMIATIFIVFISLGVFMALSTPKIYTFSTTIEVGSQVISGSIQVLESPQTLLAKMQYSYIPLALSEHKKSYPDDNNSYLIKTSVPVGSNIILMELKGTEEQGDIISMLLQTLSQKAIQDHSRIFHSIKNSLEAMLNSATNDLNSIKNSSNNETQIVAYKNIIGLLTSQLTNLRNTRQVLPPIISLEPTGGGRLLIVIFSIVAGIFLGVFVAFFTEFLSKVKLKINEEDETYSRQSKT